MLPVLPMIRGGARRGGPSRRLPRVVVSVALIAGLVAGVVLSRWMLWRIHLKRFAVVQEGILYRSAQPTQHGIEVLIDRFGVHTVACLRREDGGLRRSLFDRCSPGGHRESAVVAELGARHLHWPMGAEAHWPWFGPRQFEDFFALMDEPGNYPVAVHCIGGRHRTGSFAAIYRMEYQGWSRTDALREMFTFDFGAANPIQDHNLRTYFPRPLPGADEWSSLQATFGPLLEHPPDYATLIRSLRPARERPEIENAVASYVRDERPFALCLAHRLIDEANDPLAVAACGQAAERLERLGATATDWSIAAALVADFGDARQQRRLLDLLTEESSVHSPTDAPSPRYQAVVRGVANRYTDNRLAFLRPILADLRPYADVVAAEKPGGAEPYRYCDTAVSRLCTIVDCYGVPGPSTWEESRQRFVQWFAEHPEACRPTRRGEFQLERSPPPDKREDRDDYR